jgi:D-alanine-D-alanine ligase
MIKKVCIIKDGSRETLHRNEESKHIDHQKSATLDTVREVLEKRYDVVVLKADAFLPAKLEQEKPDIVFNLSSGIEGESRQSQIPAILEMLRLPYTGSGTLAHSLALNKGMAKQIFLQNRVPTAKFQIFTSLDQELDKSLKFPLIVKPSCEGSGMGVHRDSVVYNEKDLYRIVGNRLKEYEEDILVEEFIDGREFTVGIVGNGPKVKVLPILEINFDNVPEESGKFYTFETKTKMGHLTNFYCPAPVTDELREKIEMAALGAYNSLKCRDVSRVDIRVKDDMPYVLEINTLPGLQKGYSDLPRMAEAGGMTYDYLINFILESAAKRYGILDSGDEVAC